MESKARAAIAAAGDGQKVNQDEKERGTKAECGLFPITLTHTFLQLS